MSSAAMLLSVLGHRRTAALRPARPYVSICCVTSVFASWDEVARSSLVKACITVNLPLRRNSWVHQHCLFRTKIAPIFREQRHWGGGGGGVGGVKKTKNIQQKYFICRWWWLFKRLWGGGGGGELREWSRSGGGEKRKTYSRSILSAGGDGYL